MPYRASSRRASSTRTSPAGSSSKTICPSGPLRLPSLPPRASSLFVALTSWTCWKRSLAPFPWSSSRFPLSTLSELYQYISVPNPPSSPRSLDVVLVIVPFPPRSVSIVSPLCLHVCTHRYYSPPRNDIIVAFSAPKADPGVHLVCLS